MGPLRRVLGGAAGGGGFGLVDIDACEAQVGGMARVVEVIDERHKRFQDLRFKISNLYKLNTPHLDP